MILINHSGKKLKIDARKMGFFMRGLGLMFRSRNSDNLLFDFSRDVKISFHSLFVFFPFIIIWLDSSNRVIEWRVVRPFSLTISPKRKFRRVVEVPLNEKNECIVRFFKK